MRFITGFFTALIVLLLAASAYVYTGSFDVAASTPHSAFGRWLYGTAMQRSVIVRAANVGTPPRFTDETTRAGFEHYDEMCTTCHGGPGLERTEIAEGLNPQAPALSDVVRNWTPRQLFWIIKNGVKMTAMPSFGKTHTDEQIWSIVAFVEKLPGMSPTDYQGMREQDASNAHEHAAHGGD